MLGGGFDDGLLGPHEPRGSGIVRYPIPRPSPVVLVALVLYATLSTVTVVVSVIPMVEAQAGSFQYDETEDIHPAAALFQTILFSINTVAYITFAVSWARREQYVFSSITKMWSYDQTVYVVAVTLILLYANGVGSGEKRGGGGSGQGFGEDKGEGGGGDLGYGLANNDRLCERRSLVPVLQPRNECGLPDDMASVKLWRFHKLLGALRSVPMFEPPLSPKQ